MLFSLRVLLQSCLVKGDCGIDIDTRTLMGYDVYHIIRIK